MFYFRLNKIRVLNNRELLGKAEVQLLSFVSPDSSDFPKIDEIFNINDENEKKRIIESAVKKVAGSVQLPEIKKIKDKQTIFFGDTGITLFRTDSIPVEFNGMLMAIESDKATRRNAGQIQKFLSKDKLNTIVSTVLSLVSLTNPVSAAITTLAPLIFEGICEVFKNDKDDQIGVNITSFVKSQHYPNGKRDSQNVPDTTGNMFVDYTIFSD